MLARPLPPSPEELMYREEISAELHTCLARLSQKEQELLHALCFKGASETALSTQTGISQQLINYRKKESLGS